MQHIPLFNRILECGLSSTAHHYLIGGKYSSGPWFRVQDLLATVDTADLASPPTRHQQGPVGDGKALAGFTKVWGNPQRLYASHFAANCQIV